MIDPESMGEIGPAEYSRTVSNLNEALVKYNQSGKDEAFRALIEANLAAFEMGLKLKGEGAEKENKIIASAEKILNKESDTEISVEQLLGDARNIIDTKNEILKAEKNEEELPEAKTSEKKPLSARREDYKEEGGVIGKIKSWFN